MIISRKKKPKENFDAFLFACQMKLIHKNQIIKLSCKRKLFFIAYFNNGRDCTNRKYLYKCSTSIKFYRIVINGLFPWRFLVIIVCLYYREMSRLHFITMRFTSRCLITILIADSVACSFILWKKPSPFVIFFIRQITSHYRCELSNFFQIMCI